MHNLVDLSVFTGLCDHRHYFHILIWIPKRRPHLFSGRSPAPLPQSLRICPTRTFPIKGTTHSVIPVTGYCHRASLSKIVHAQRAWCFTPGPLRTMQPPTLYFLYACCFQCPWVTHEVTHRREPLGHTVTSQALEPPQQSHHPTFRSQVWAWISPRPRQHSLPVSDGPSRGGKGGGACGPLCSGTTNSTSFRSR